MGSHTTASDSAASGRRDVRRAVRESTVVQLVRAAHPVQAALTAVAIGAASFAFGRSPAGAGLVALTVLVGQAILGWHNDLVDVDRDRSHERRDKPLVSGPLESGTVWFAIACAVLAVVPMSVYHSLLAGLSHLAILVIALATNSGLLRRTAFSPLPWAASFALWPAFLSYAVPTPAPPTIALTAAAALIGVGVHVAVSLRGLVTDHQDGSGALPLRLALRVGAPKLLVITGVYLALATALAIVVGLTVGLRQ